MIETAVQSEHYAVLADEVIEEHNDLKWIRAAGVTVGYLESARLKKKKNRQVLGECIRVRDLYRCFIPYEFLIVIYAPNVAGMTEDQLKILLYHELLHVGMSEDGSEVRYEVNPHDVEEFRTIIDRYGIDWAKP